MKPETKRKCMKGSTIIGCIFLLLPNGLYWYWGNMSVYSMSYIVAVLNSTSGVTIPWIISTFFVFWSIGLTTSNFMSRKIGRRNVILVGAALADIGIFSTYFANQHSMAAIVVTMGVLLGYGTGFIDGSALQLVIEWADDDVGTLTALLQASFSFGGIVINELWTFYTNPLNLTPDLEIGKLEYFTQKPVLDNVPTMYLIQGLFSVLFHVVGFLMLRPKPKEDKPSPLQEETSTKLSSASFNGASSQRESVTKEAMTVGTSFQSEDSPIAQNDTKSTKRYTHGYGECAPREMVRLPSFYAMWVAFFLGDVPFLLITNYYKIYGQQFIHDDHFLTTLGTMIIVFNIFASVLWGVLMDRFGAKKCLTVFLGFLVASISWYYFTPWTNRWLYFVSTITIGCVSCSIYSCFTAASALLYGKTNFSTNFGILMTSSLLTNIVAPYTMKTVLSSLGWFSLFAMGSVCNLVSLIAILIFIPSV